MIYMVHATLNKYCLLYFAEDLFSDYYLCIISGRVGDKKALQKKTSYNSKIIASQQMFNIERLKLKQGYTYSNTLDEFNYALTPEII